MVQQLEARSLKLKTYSLSGEAGSSAWLEASMGGRGQVGLNGGQDTGAFQVSEDMCPS